MGPGITVTNQNQSLTAVAFAFTVDQSRDYHVYIPNTCQTRSVCRYYSVIKPAFHDADT